jgi:glycine cleavage system H protein
MMRTCFEGVRPMGSLDPNSLKYAKTHEWIHVEEDIATVGISDFAVKQLTDLVYIELPSKGAILNAGEPFGEVESVKAVSDLYAPLGGEVVDVNQSLEDEMDVLSHDPYGQGWLIKLKIADPAPLEQLLDRTTYEAHCAREEH